MIRVALLAPLLLGMLAPPAAAHGGGGYRGPPGPPPPGCSEPWPGPPPPPPVGDGTGPVTGRILGSDGAPLADAWVWYADYAVVQTDADGRFRCAPHRYPARLIVTASAHAATIIDAPIAAAPGADLDLGDTTLPVGASIVGTMPKGVDTPIWGLRLRIVPETRRTPEAFGATAKVTGWDGVRVRPGARFAFHGLADGLYRLIADHDGRRLVLRSHIRPGGETLTPDPWSAPTDEEPPVVEHDGVLLLRGTAGRRVRVVDRTRGCELPAEPDDRGLRVAAPSSSMLDVIVGDDEGIDPALEGLSAGREVHLPPVATRTFVAGVVRRPDGTPVPWAGVQARSASDVADGALVRAALTDAAGRFRIDGVAGRLRLNARAPGLNSAEHPVEAMAGADAVVVVVDELPIPEVRAEPAASPDAEASR